MQFLVFVLFTFYGKDSPYLMSQLNIVVKKIPSEDIVIFLLFLNRVLNLKIHYSSSLPDSSNRTYLFFFRVP